jgi:hypothetical protein
MESWYLSSQCPGPDPVSDEYATWDLVKEAKESGNEWTRYILKLPKIKVNQVTVPDRTTTGKNINRVERKSDLVRTTVLVEFGGIYLDTDVVALKDVKDLRENGFANVVGLQRSEALTNGNIRPVS